MSKITMIYSLFGENDFILNLELQKLVKDFQINKFEIYRYAFENNDISIDDIIKIKDNIDAQDLFCNKKAIIIKNLDEKNTTKKNLKPLIDSLSKIETLKDIIVVFANAKQPSFLAKLKFKKQEYKKLEKEKLNNFINEIAEENNVKLTAKAKNLLASFYSNNIGIIYNEIIKLSNYKPTIDDNDILDLIVEPNLSNIFSLTDAISAKNKPLAIKLLFKEYNAGTSDLLIFGTIISQIRNAILIKERQKTPSIKIEVHPFVQQKLKYFVNSFDIKQLKIMYSKLFKYDLQIKKGKIDAILALEIFITENI